MFTWYDLTSENLENQGEKHKFYVKYQGKSGNLGMGFQWKPVIHKKITLSDISTCFIFLLAGWSLTKLFGRKLFSVCPVATISKLIIDVNDKSVSFSQHLYLLDK